MELSAVETTELLLLSALCCCNAECDTGHDTDALVSSLQKSTKQAVSTITKLYTAAANGLERINPRLKQNCPILSALLA